MKLKFCLFISLALLSFIGIIAFAGDYDYLGNYSSNEYDPNSISNPFGAYGSPYSLDSVTNQYSTYGSPYSPNSVNNPYAIDTPKLYSSDGTYLGKVSNNQCDPDSISNPYGKYGSKYSPDSVNNPYGQYGSKYSSKSANNPYTIDPPKIFYEKENSFYNPTVKSVPPVTPEPSMGNLSFEDLIPTRYKSIFDK
jgi:hypothetical protein